MTTSWRSHFCLDEDEWARPEAFAPTIITRPSALPPHVHCSAERGTQRVIIDHHRYTYFYLGMSWRQVSRQLVNAKPRPMHAWPIPSLSSLLKHDALLVSLTLPVPDRTA